MPGPGIVSAFLAGLELRIRARLEPLLEPVSLRADQVLIAPGQQIEYVHFLLGGLATMTYDSAGRQTSVALIGPETFTGHSILLDREQSSCRTMMQVPGSGYRLRADDLRRLADHEPALRSAMLHAVDDLLQQVAEAAFVNAQMTVEARLARLLLMASDRLGGNDMRLTHDRLAHMLGCRRAGVTMSIHLLEGEHAIRATRAHIILLDRAKLRAIAGASHHRNGMERSESAIVLPSAIPPHVRM